MSDHTVVQVCVTKRELEHVAAALLDLRAHYSKSGREAFGEIVEGNGPSIAVTAKRAADLMSLEGQVAGLQQRMRGILETLD